MSRFQYFSNQNLHFSGLSFKGFCSERYGNKVILGVLLLSSNLTWKTFKGHLVLSSDYDLFQSHCSIFTKTEQFFSFRHNFILTTFRIHLFQWLVPEHSATAVPPAGPCSDLGRDTGGPAASIGWHIASLESRFDKI